MEDVSVHVSSAGPSPFFLALSFIIVTRKAETLTGMCHCGLCWVCARVCVFVCDQTHTDRWRTDRKARFIYRFALSFTVLFWRTGRSCPHCSTMTSHALRHVSLNESLSPVFLPQVDFPGNLSETFEFETSNPLLDLIGVQQTPSKKVTMDKCTHLYVHNTHVHLCMGPSSAVKQGIPPLLRLSA